MTTMTLEEQKAYSDRITAEAAEVLKRLTPEQTTQLMNETVLPLVNGKYSKVPEKGEPEYKQYETEINAHTAWYGSRMLEQQTAQKTR
jgi:hypothetical protein